MNSHIFLNMLVALLTVTDLLGGEPIWQKEISCEVNMGCSSAVVASDMDKKKLIILGSSIRNQDKERDFLIWEIDPNGDVTNRAKFGEISKKAAVMPLSLQLSGISFKDINNIMVLGRFDGNTPSPSLLTMDRKGETQSVKLLTDSKSEKVIDDTLVLKMKSATEDSLAIVGRKGNNGFITKTDKFGNELWEKTFDINNTELFSDVATDSGGFYVTGQSVNIKSLSKAGFDETKNFLLLYNMDGQLLKQDYFEGVCSTKFPQVARMNSGTVLVAYDKNVVATDLNVRAYSSDLNLLWEKQVITAGGNGPPGHFKILASYDKFYVGDVYNGGELAIAECSSDGQVIERWNLGNVVGPFGEIQLAALNENVYVVFSTKSYGELHNVRIRVLRVR